MDDLVSSFKAQFNPHKSRESHPGGPLQLENSPLPPPPMEKMFSRKGKEQDLFVNSGANDEPKLTKKQQELRNKRLNAIQRVLNSSDTDWYDILGVSDQCDADDAIQAYKKLAPLVHPDKNGNSTESHQAFVSEY